MRPLTEEETKAVFESELHDSRSLARSKANPVELANYIGKNLVHLIDRDEDDAYCFRLSRDRYVHTTSLVQSTWTTNPARENKLAQVPNLS